MFRIRNHMVDVKENFKSNYENSWCILCLLFTETQQHLIDCVKIREKFRGIIKFENLKIEMAFQKLEDQEYLAKYYTMILNARTDILSQDIGSQ